MSPQVKSPGFFLFEIIIVLIIVLGFAILVLNWHSNFIEQKNKIFNHGRALMIAADFLELVRIDKAIPKKFDIPAGFKITSSVIRHNLKDFAEINVKVEYGQANSLSLTTGVILNE